MYNNPYTTPYTPQANIDRINEQIAHLETMRKQIEQQPRQQPANVTQNFQLAPTNREVMKYASSIDEVERYTVMNDTPYFSKDMSVVWIKNTKGDIKTFELTEIVPQDEKDIQIQLLQEQINELRRGLNEQHSTTTIQPETTTNTTGDGKTTRTATKKTKSTSVSRVPKSKTE